MVASATEVAGVKLVALADKARALDAGIRAAIDRIDAVS